MLEKSDILIMAKRMAGIGLLCCASVFSAPANENSAPPPPSSSISGEGSGGGDEALGRLSTGAWVNEFTGQPAFSVPLTRVSNQGGIGFEVRLKYYGGGLEHQSQSDPKYSKVSWVGEGFSFAAPSISAQTKGTLSLHDDDYSISLDGQSFSKLIPENGNPDILYPSDNPYIKVQREREPVTMIPSDPYLSAAGSAPPTSVPSQPAYQVVGWTVTLSDGNKYKFGSGSAACDDSNTYSFCVPVVGDKIGYQPFYNYGTGASTSRISVQWYLREIRSRDNGFSIFLEYDKITQPVTGIAYATGGPASPSVSADRAIYLKKVFSVNGTSPTNAKITTLVLSRGPRLPGDYWDSIGFTTIDPLARFELERLREVRTYIRSDTVPEVRYRLEYTSITQYARSQLNHLLEIRGSRLRRLYSFSYDTSAGANWRLKTVTGPNSAKWTYTYTPPPGSFDLNPQVLDLKTLNFGGTTHNPLTNFDSPRIFMHQEIGNKLYIGLEEGIVCPSSPTGDRWKPRLVELENFGTHWAVQRVFKAPQASCPEQAAVTLGPDGSYMAWSISSNIWIFALTPRFGPAGTIDLATPPVSMQLLSSSLRHADALPKPAMFPFENWLVAYDQVYNKSVTFFYKNSSGVWLQDPSIGCPVIPPPEIVFYMKEGFQPGDTCLDWSPDDPQSEIEVRGGSNFIAIKFSEYSISPEVEGSSIRLYSYHNGALKEFTSGLLKSRVQKLGASSDRFPRASVNYGMPDRDFIWDPAIDGFGGLKGTRILDLSVRGNLVGIILGDRSTGNRPRYMHVFSYDGLQLRFLYQVNLPSDLGVDYTSDHVFLGESYFLARINYEHYFEYKYIDPKSWSVAGPSYLPSSLLTRTSVKILDRHFHMEAFTTESERPLAFKPAVIGPGVSGYPVWPNSGILYRIGFLGLPPVQVSNLNPNPSPQSDYLYNVFQREDRFLGIALNASSGNAWSYVYGQMRASGNQVQWLPLPAGVQAMSAILLSTGVMTMEQTVLTSTNYKFSGVLRFHGDYNGSLMTAASTPPSTVTRVEVSTKLSASTLADGSLQRLDIAYPSTPRLNYASKVPNLNRAVVSSAGGRKLQTTDYIVGYVPRDPTLPVTSLFQGMVSSTQLSNIPISGTGLRPGDAHTQFHYKINTIATGWNGSTLLKESIIVPFPTKVNKDQYYFDASRATETRFALPSEKNGQPRITVTKNGGDYYVSVVRFRHEFGDSVANDLPAQTASYLFKGTDPCSGTNTDDPCSNLVNFNWLIPSSGDSAAPANAIRATASSVFTYTSLGYLSAQYSWRSKESGVSALTTLDGTTPTTSYLTQGKWIKESEVILRPSDHASIQCKHGNPTVLDVRGARATTFYSSQEGLILATVTNASKSVCTFLDAEESVSGSGRGAFGDWETQGLVSTDMAHTGIQSIKATTSFGPTVNVAFRRDANFWTRGKGLVVSGWMFVPSAPDNPNPAAFVELKPSASSAPFSGIDILARYKATHSGVFPFDRWFKLEALVTWEELNAIPFTAGDSSSNPLIRVWFGKADSASNTHPVYVDDLRVHPADAVMMSQTYDSSRRIMSRSDAENNSAFFQYDAWGGGLSVKDDKGRLFSTTAYKRIED